MNIKISITGDLGSGKSTIAKILAEEFDAKYLSTGAIQRNIASRYGMNTLEMNKYADKHKEIDDEIDNVLRDLNTSDKSFVIDSRLAWFFIPNSFKLYFTTDIEVAAKRILNDSTRVNEDYSTVEDAIADISERKKSENERFLKLYGADCANYKNFDLVLNTTELKTVAISKFIGDVLSGKIKSNNDIIWCNPQILFPTQAISDVSSEERELSVENPIRVIENKGAWAIFEGHEKVSDALNAKKAVVPVQILAKNNQILNDLPFEITASQYFEKSVTKSTILTWEAAYGFEFYKKP
jgi:CMP/dCMP kinase